MSRAYQSFEYGIKDAEELLAHFDAVNANPPPANAEVLKRIPLHTSFCSHINQWVTDIVAMLICPSGFHMNQWVTDVDHDHGGSRKRCV